MSRIGRSPITIPAGVDVDHRRPTVTVKGPKGSSPARSPAPSRARIDEGTLLVERPNDERQQPCLHGLSRTLVNNMVVGVTEASARSSRSSAWATAPSCSKGPGLESRARLQPPRVRRGARGHRLRGPCSHRVVVTGIDKEQVGQVAANIRSIRKPEPYKGKGVRYAGERIIRKAGKTGK
jgi:large subunit ribosomal protein L6